MAQGKLGMANDKVLFTLSFAAPDLRRPKAAYFLGKSERIHRRLYSERQVFLTFTTSKKEEGRTNGKHHSEQ